MSSMLGNIAIATDQTEVARRPLEADQCALVVVDIQEKLLPPIFNKEALVKNSQLLIRLAKILDLPVMVTTQYSKGLGADRAGDRFPAGGRRRRSTSWSSAASAATSSARG